MNQENNQHLFHEADIGSGEKSPGERETDEMIRRIPSRDLNHSAKPVAKSGERAKHEQRKAA